jgi:hypothetical protein
MDLEIDKEVIFPFSGSYYSQQLYHSSNLTVKIITPTIEIDIG